MGFFVKDEDYKTIVCLDEAALNVTDKKYRDKPVIAVRSSYEHQQGNSLISRSRQGFKNKTDRIIVTEVIRMMDENFEKFTEVFDDAINDLVNKNDGNNSSEIKNRG